VASARVRECQDIKALLDHMIDGHIYPHYILCPLHNDILGKLESKSPLDTNTTVANLEITLVICQSPNRAAAKYYGCRELGRHTSPTATSAAHWLQLSRLQAEAFFQLKTSVQALTP
jgi:hypothetical protein